MLFLLHFHMSFFYLFHLQMFLTIWIILEMFLTIESFFLESFHGLVFLCFHILIKCHATMMIQSLLFAKFTQRHNISILSILFSLFFFPLPCSLNGSQMPPYPHCSFMIPVLPTIISHPVVPICSFKFSKSTNLNSVNNFQWWPENPFLPTRRTPTPVRL